MSMVYKITDKRLQEIIDKYTDIDENDLSQEDGEILLCLESLSLYRMIIKRIAENWKLLQNEDITW